MEGKVFAITGVRGMGLSVAKKLRDKGAFLSLADVSQSSLDTAVQQLATPSEHILTTVVDVGSREAVEKWIDATMAKFGRLDGAANMAGYIGKYHGVSTLAEQDDNEWDMILRVNLTGLMYCLRAELRHLTAGGSIVNAASIQGIRGFAKHAAYSSSKHGVVGLTRSVAQETGERARINAIAP